MRKHVRGEVRGAQIQRCAERLTARLWLQQQLAVVCKFPACKGHQNQESMRKGIRLVAMINHHRNE